MKKNNVIPKEKAAEEFSAWLEYQQVSDKTISENEDSIDRIVNKISSGDMIINEDKSMLFRLSFPIGADSHIKELSIKNRITRRDALPHLNGVKPTDADGRILAYSAALTGQNKAILSEMDSRDQKILDSIVAFFIV